jgi:thiol:disulfide interchange protein DsbC
VETFLIMCYNFGMLKLVVTAFIIILMALSCPAFAAESPASSVITPAEALSALKEVIPEVKVIEVNATPVQGLFEVVVETKGQKGVVYLDSSRKYLVSGSLVDIGAKRNLTQEKSYEINKVNVSEIPLDDALVMGDRNAAKKVIVFSDPD